MISFNIRQGKSEYVSTSKGVIYNLLTKKLFLRRNAKNDICKEHAALFVLDRSAERNVLLILLHKKK
jgi:hypothetical protein